MVMLSLLGVSLPAGDVSALIVVVGPAAVASELSSLDSVRTMTARDVEEEGFPEAKTVVIGPLLPDGPSQAFLDRLSERVLLRRGLVLLYDAVALAFDAFDPAYRFGPSPQLGWYRGLVGGGSNLRERSAETPHQFPDACTGRIPVRHCTKVLIGIYTEILEMNEVFPRALKESP